MGEAHRQIKGLEGRVLEVKYEEFLANPQENLVPLAKFCDLEADEDAIAIARVAGKVRKSRAFAYKSNPVLDSFAKSVQRRLAEYGY